MGIMKLGIIFSVLVYSVHRVIRNGFGLMVTPFLQKINQSKKAKLIYKTKIGWI